MKAFVVQNAVMNFVRASDNGVAGLKFIELFFDDKGYVAFEQNVNLQLVVNVRRKIPLIVVICFRVVVIFNFQAFRDRRRV